MPHHEDDDLAEDTATVNARRRAEEFRMLIERSVPGSARMETLPTDAMVRVWLSPDRFVTIRAVNNETALLIEHFQAPGGGSYATALNLQPNSFNGIVIK